MPGGAGTRTRTYTRTHTQGTLAADGVGLLAACLRHFCEMPLPPRLLACTHYQEVMDPAVLPRCGVPCVN